MAFFEIVGICTTIVFVLVLIMLGLGWIRFETGVEKVDKKNDR